MEHEDFWMQVYKKGNFETVIPKIAEIAEKAISEINELLGRSDS